MNAIDAANFLVLVNDEDQHSIWPGAKAIPTGWTRKAAFPTREACISFVDETWTDMRPLSLQRAMRDNA